VEILGAIGESWFEEGNTLESVKAQLSGLDVSNVLVEVASAGGDLVHGLALHDMFKTMNSKVTARIIGSTASAGTVVALGADVVEITENSKFLIHNSMTMTAGNADDHEAAAVNLKEFDSSLYNIYRKKTGKPKSQIKALMKDERWISSDEAKDWGFVDKIVKPKVNNKIENDMKQVLDFFNVKTEDEVLTKVQALKDSVSELENQIVAKEAEIEELNDRIAENEMQKIEAFVKAAKEAGKITDEQIPHIMAMAEKDFENAKAYIDSIKVEQKPNFKNYVNEGADGQKEVVKDYDWYVKNDAKELLRLMDEEPDKYNELIVNKKKARRK